MQCQNRPGFADDGIGNVKISWRRSLEFQISPAPGAVAVRMLRHELCCRYSMYTFAQFETVRSGALGL